MKLYYISGLGANEKAFQKIKFPKHINQVYIPWLQPFKNESIQNYAQRMAININTNEEFCLLGLSFGGIIAQEIYKIKPAKKLILISSIKSYTEKPLYMKFSSKTLTHKLIPTSFFTSDKVLSYTFFRKVYNSSLPSINDIFVFRNKFYLKWAINQMINWKSDNSTIKNLYHIHGEIDLIFPIKKIINPIVIRGGNHIMILQRYNKISEILGSILSA